jgi:hypothetical protein
MADVEFEATSGLSVALADSNQEETYVAGLQSAVSQLVAAGHEVFVVMPTPGFPKTVNASWFWYPSNCATYEALLDTPSCGMSRPLQEVVDETSEIDSLLEVAIVASGGKPVQLRESLCRDGICATNFGNEWLYFDGTHLSVAGSESLAPTFTELLR